MTSLLGTPRRGTGMASTNLVQQLPLLASEMPELRDCHPGTLNLELEQALVVAVPDHRTRPILWSHDFPKGEVFDLLRILIEAPVGSAAQPAWLYVAHLTLHRKTPRIHEVIGPFLPRAHNGRCRIHIDRQVISLPYEMSPTLVVC